MSSHSMKPVVLHLYRSLRRKARIAIKSSDHLFRFQRGVTGELWGKGYIYDVLNDRKLLESIFPSSIHSFIDNRVPFNPLSFSSDDNDHKLHSEYYPDFIRDLDFDHAYDAVTNEEKLKEKISTEVTPTSSSLYSTDNTIINEYDYHRLKKIILNIFRSNKSETSISKINELINDGFNVLKEFDKQILLNSTTSISESAGIRIISTSSYIADIIGNDPYKPYSFTYKIRIENHSHSWIQLLGRHWVIIDNNDNKETLERFQPGVVGLQPQLQPGQVFIYGSGTFMPTKTGKMYGAFQFTNMSGELFEVPIATFALNADL